MHFVSPLWTRRQRNSSLGTDSNAVGSPTTMYVSVFEFGSSSRIKVLTFMSPPHAAV